MSTQVEGAKHVCGSHLAMPLIILNMGGEMMYILHQRLQAQKIAEQKSKRVLQDVLATIFSRRFIDELFKPQKVYTAQATRQIFNRLAHSSIMRLNESSMDKLYDLMTMGFKHQIINAKTSTDLIAITLTHIDSLTALLPSDSLAVPLLERTRMHIVRNYTHLDHGTLYVIHQTLMRFLQDRRIKVSLFLQNKFQNSDGTFKLKTGGQMAYGFEVPGTVHYYKDGKQADSQDLQISSNYSPDVVEGSAPPNFTNNFVNAGLGRDLYAKRAMDNATKGPKKSRTDGNPPPPPCHASPPPKPDRRTQQKAAAKELNLLADLMGAAAEATTTSSSVDRGSIINIDFGLHSTSTKNARVAASGANVVKIGAASEDARREAIMAKIGDLGLEDEKDDETGGNGEDEEEDLLGLLE